MTMHAEASEAPIEGFPLTYICSHWMQLSIEEIARPL